MTTKPNSGLSSNARGYRRVGTTLLLVAMVFALLGGAALFSTARDAEQAAREQVETTRRVLESVNEVLELMLNAQISKRGYLLTGDRVHLETFNEAVNGVPRAMEMLEKRLHPKAEHAQQETLGRLTDLLEQRIAEMRDMVALKTAGKDEEALSLVPRDDAATKNIRSLLAELAGKERAVVEHAVKEAEAADERTLHGFYGLGFAGLMLSFLGIWLSRRAHAFEETARTAEIHKMLAVELNHRIKNLFAIVGAIITLSARGAESPEDAAAKARERIMALGRAHEASQNMLGTALINLERLIDVILQPYEAGSRLTVSGPPVSVPASAITPLGLVLHEWATNAAKYGALSGKKGQLSVEWEYDEDSILSLKWSETGGPKLDEEPEDTGFGSKLEERSVQQLDGELGTEWRPQGVLRTLRLRLDEETA